jgi:primosomal protein N' (replication factor Y)
MEGTALVRATDTWVQVLVDAPGNRQSYTYRLAPGMAAVGGDVVQVPFGGREVGGVVLTCADRPPPEVDPRSVRPVSEVLGRGLFPPGFWGIIERVAEYYLAPLPRVLETALPPGLLSRPRRRVRLGAANPLAEWALGEAARALLERLRATGGEASWRHLEQKVPQAGVGLAELLGYGLVESYLATADPPKARTRQVVILLGDELEDLTPRQREVLAELRRMGGEAAVEAFTAQTGTSRETLARLAALGRVRVEARPVRRNAVACAAPDRPKTLTDEQRAAVEAIAAAGARTVLVHGVTGSGKTEIYLQAIAPVLARGLSVLVLVPEIGLTPQLTDRFTARFGDRVQVYHSALSVGERYDAWREMLGGEPQVVIGTRSAVFAPLPRLGLIVLDEEHDGSYKQDRPAPCYHARTVAEWRAQAAGCPLVLGSATPDADTYRRAVAGTHLHLCLARRVANRPLPAVEVVDMRSELADGNWSPFSRRLQQELERTHQKGHQAILFINRRGYSTFVLCRSCGEVLRCPHCAVSFTYHRLTSGEFLRCHYCNAHRDQPRTCPACRSPNLRYFGAGTQRVAAQLEELLPALRVLRFDRDTTGRKGAHRDILDRFARGEADVLVGTQMLAKGLDLPQVTLVGILAADGLLNLPDFRSGERAFQLLTQVAGRAGRGEEPGRVILQTYAPEHPVVEAACTHDYERFVTAELQMREALAYPPFAQFIALQFTGLHEARVVDVAEAVSAILEGSADFEGNLLGPAPCTIERIAGRYRWQLLVRNSAGERGRARLRELLSAFHPRGGVGIAVDVDPLRLL